MDIVYHRNCLDGIYSSYLFWLLSRTITLEQLTTFIEHIKQHSQHNLTTELTTCCHNIKQSNTELLEINEELFHKQLGVPYNVLSLFAGEFYHFCFPGHAKVLFIVDTSLGSVENIKLVAHKYELVLIIDHHTTFSTIIQHLSTDPINNCYYIFQETQCAAKLVYNLLECCFNLSLYYQSQAMTELKTILEFVNKNDLKIHENMLSKQFVLGFYDFGIEMSHLNPLIYKRIGMLPLSYVLDKGSTLYNSHIAALIKEISKASCCEIHTNSFKPLKCLYLTPENPTKISDIGILLAYLSATNNLENLCILVMKSKTEYRISTRSHRAFNHPLALELAEHFHGGGHLLAAGFKLPPKVFQHHFKLTKTTFTLELSSNEVEKILYWPT